MNRDHTRRELCAPDRDASARPGPDIAISGDFIVGFPGETRRATSRRRCSLVREVGYAIGLLVQVFAAAPARPPPTMAGPGATKRSRTSGWHALQRPAVTNSSTRLQPRPGGQDAARAVREDRAATRARPIGRSPYLQAVHVDGAGSSDRSDRSRQDRGRGPDQPGRSRLAEAASRPHEPRARNSLPCPTPRSAPSPGPTAATWP